MPCTTQSLSTYYNKSGYLIQNTRILGLCDKHLSNFYTFYDPRVAPLYTDRCVFKK